MADLSPLDRLVAESECLKLINRYLVLSDDRAWDAVTDLFTEDGVFARPTDPANPFHGREAIRAQYHARPMGKLNRHIVANAVVDVESATEARGFSYVLLYLGVSPEGGGPAKADTQLIGAFTDRFERVDGVWKIKARIGSLSMTS
jgi:hypothetical protein